MKIISPIIIWLTALFVTLITFFLYFSALQNGFVNWDDNLYIYENTYIRSINTRLLYWIPEVIIWHPITMFSFAIDYAFWELNPFGYHLTNNLLHSINTFLVFILVIRLAVYSDSNNNVGKKSVITALITSLLFGIHPLHVESVAWISERKDVLSAFFCLLTLLSYLRYKISNTIRKKVMYYALCLILFTLALMSKPMSVSLPAILLIIDFYPLRLDKKQDIKWIIIEKIPFFLLSLSAMLAAIWAQYAGGALKTFEVLPLGTRIFTAVWAYMFYLFKLTFPFNLAPLYPHPVKIDFFSFKYVFSFITFTIITFICIKFSNKNRIFLSLWVYYVIALVPVIGLVQFGIHETADRFVYLPSLGPFIFFSLSVSIIFERYLQRFYKIAIFVVLVIVLIILMSVRTVRQIGIWHNSIILWSHQLKLYPKTAIAYNQRGMAFYDIGNYQLAINDYDMALKFDSQFEHAYNNRGNVYYKLGNYPQAIKEYETALDLNPKFATVYYNLGLSYSKIGNSDMGLLFYKEAAELGYVPAQNYLRENNILW